MTDDPARASLDPDMADWCTRHLDSVPVDVIFTLRAMLPGVHVIDRLRHTEVTREAIAYITGNL